ncbi:MAG TPA: hypothetical protein VN700_03360 [Vicinamibacterales bacterium]|nr:hypothetical protein [Vicinamibacterales bacterium]
MIGPQRVRYIRPCTLEQQGTCHQPNAAMKSGELIGPAAAAN